MAAGSDSFAPLDLAKVQSNGLVVRFAAGKRRFEMFSTRALSRTDHRKRCQGLSASVYANENPLRLIGRLECF